MVHLVQFDGNIFLEHGGASIILPGGFGSEVDKYVDGSTFETGEHAFIASLDAPDTVGLVHGEYAEAGAQVLTADTFSTSPWRCGKDFDLARQATHAACNIAKGVAQEHEGRLVFASVTSLNSCYKPEETPKDDAVLDEEHAKTARIIAEIDDVLVLAETLPTVREAQAIAKAATAQERAFFAAFVVNEQGKVLDGSSMEEVVETVLQPNKLCLGVGVNCCSIEGARLAVTELSQIFKQQNIQNREIVVYPNGFVHDHEENHRLADEAKARGESFKPEVHSPQAFSKILREFHAAGATALGGCCGTTPEHTRAWVQIGREQVMEVA